MPTSSRWNQPESANTFVLVVDSEPRSLIFTSMLVQRLGYHACSALGVGNALEIAGTTAPSLVVTDLRLKGLGGLDLLERLREKPETSSIPVVILTREPGPGVEEQCRRAGAAACLEKPVRAGRLYRTIHPLIEPGTRRSDVRIETRLPVTVNDRPLDCADGECATNLSVRGIYLRTRTSYPVNSRVALRLTLNEEEIEAEARVAYCRPPEDGCSGMWGAGLEFVKSSPEAGEIIRRFIHDEVTHGMDDEADPGEQAE